MNNQALSPPAALAGAAVLKLKAGDTVFQAGDACDNFLFVLSGSVRVDMISLSGKAVLLYRIGPGQSCVMTTSCLMSGRDYSAEATAETDCVACALSASLFQEKLSHSAYFRELVFDVFADRLGALMDKVEEVAFGSIDRRLARRILERLDHGPELTMTHEELAVDLGSSREVISRKLSKWSDHGLIKKAHRSIEILDVSALTQLAQADD
ncbi:MAG: Crp/Fnr family transcriptional regulator [Erythrobacteraceae bacterium]|nr:Crp/Fnr family transcriptional regulator [Erythrobacteraceae bacterium]